MTSWIFGLALSFLHATTPLVHFADEVDLSEKFIEEVNKESSSIRLATFRLSSRKVVRALAAAHRRGVKVEVIVDATAITPKSAVKKLADLGVKVLVWQDQREKKPSSRMHHNFCVFGTTTSWTGSYVFKEKVVHREEALVVQDENVAKIFLERFRSMQAKETVSLATCLSSKKGG